MIEGISQMGSATIETMQSLREQLFAKLDENGDGVLDQTEIQALTDRFEQQSENTMSIEDRFAETDTNGDGFIDQDEFLAAGPPPGGPPPGMMPQFAASGYDSDDETQTLLDVLNAQNEEESVNLYA